MKNILVTGGAGFLGSHITLLLLEKGYKVFLLDSFENSSPKSLDKICQIGKLNNSNYNSNLKIYKGNLCDKNFIEKLFLDVKENNQFINGVIHLGGLKAVKESLENPFSYWKTNVLGTINLLEIMIKYKCNNFVFSSSATIYAQNKDSSLKEDSLLLPINPYGNTKLTVETLLADLFNAYKKEFRFASLRYFNPIGAHHSGLIGEDPKGLPNNIFPLICNTAMGLHKEIKIFGNDWPTKDGTPIRDYIHVMDLAEVHIKVYEYLESNIPNLLKLNVGTGHGTSVLELIKVFEKINNVKIPFTFSERRPGDSGVVVADNSLMKSTLNFVPKLSVEEMCKDGWNWKKLNPNGY